MKQYARQFVLVGLLIAICSTCYAMGWTVSCGYMDPANSNLLTAQVVRKSDRTDLAGNVITGFDCFINNSFTNDFNAKILVSCKGHIVGAVAKAFIPKAMGGLVHIEMYPDGGTTLSNYSVSMTFTPVNVVGSATIAPRTITGPLSINNTIK